MWVPSFLGRYARKWKLFPVKHLITCPENHLPSGVDLDILHQLVSCSRWPERADCGRECLRQIEAAPHECRVRTILERWYAGKTCAVCGQLFGDIHWEMQKPGLLLAEKSIVDWDGVAVEQLRESLAVAQPVCCACYLAARLIREHPDLVVDRSRKRNA